MIYPVNYIDNSPFVARRLIGSQTKGKQPEKRQNWECLQINRRFVTSVRFQHTVG